MTTLHKIKGRLPHNENTGCKLRLRDELMAFWARNPRGSFTASVIAGALDCKRGEAKLILDELYKEGLIKTCVRERNTFYSLTGDLSKHESPFQYPVHTDVDKGVRS